MNWAWAGSLDQLWRSPAFPMWLTLAAAGFFGIVVLITLLRAEKSIANGALAVITLLAVGIALAATIRGYGPEGRSVTAVNRSASVATAGLPALSCIDELAGDVVLAACERALFGSPENAAAAVSYAASQIARLTALDAAAANKNLTPELQVLRRALEHDRYGLVAHVLVARDNCTPADCAAFGALTDRQHIVANMDAHLYESLIARYSPSWNAPSAMSAGPMGSVPTAMLPVSLPTGKPTNAEFPSAASTPPISIMNPEPGTGTATGATPPRTTPPTAAAPASLPKPPTASVQASAPPAAKKPAPKPRAPAAAAPVQIAPDPVQPAAAANE